MENSRNSTIAALIKMLDDPDDRVFPVVRDKLISMGKEVLPPLEAAIEDCFDEFLEARMNSVKDEVHQSILLNEVIGWKMHDADNLLKGYMLVSRMGDRDLDEIEILSQIAQLKTDIWIELHQGLTALENIRVMNHVFYKVHHFEGNIPHFADPDSTYIQTVLKNRKGSPLALGLVYMILCQQLGLPVYGVNLPQHFILAYLNRPWIPEPKVKDILFYINPFNNGGVFTRLEIDHYISQLKIQSEPSYYLPCSNMELIRRLLNSLLFIFRSKDEESRIREAETLLNNLE